MGLSFGRIAKIAPIVLDIVRQVQQKRGSDTPNEAKHTEAKDRVALLIGAAAGDMDLLDRAITVAKTMLRNEQEIEAIWAELQRRKAQA